MNDTQLYTQILGITNPWNIVSVDMLHEQQQIQITIHYSDQDCLHCPVCKAKADLYDTKTRRWRHLDTCQFLTILEAEVPRVNCSEHGVKQLHVPWAEKGSRYTSYFESFVISWLHHATIQSVANQVKLSWDTVEGI